MTLVSEPIVTVSVCAVLPISLPIVKLVAAELTNTLLDGKDKAEEKLLPNGSNVTPPDVFKLIVLIPLGQISENLRVMLPVDVQAPLDGEPI